MTFKRKFYYFLYRTINMHTLGSNEKFFFISKALRNFVVRRFVIYSGKKIRVCRKAKIGFDIRIGDHSGIGENSIIENGTSIGNNVLMGPNVQIYTHNHDFSRTDIPIRLQGFSDIKEVIIGNDVWIGANVIILPGVTIGDGCVIGAGSVVTKDAPSFSIICGNPAVIKGRRNNE